jgi:lysyl-tRNA synthetase class 2
MYLRIALELPLKKLLVGGFERIYEIGRNFRNEGISRKHNPEFSMLEYYQAYATYEDLMNQTEEMYRTIVQNVCGTLQITYGEHSIDFSGSWPRISMLESVHAVGGVSREFNLDTVEGVQSAARAHKVHLEEPSEWGRSLEALWGELVEHKLINPTFITHHPFSISPLARKNEKDPKITDRFELIIAGMESANAFSELNDAVDQRERFEAQAKRKEDGDEEASDVDEDFLRALEHGMPPAGGLGLGIDRLVMLLTNSQSIRDVLLFPQLKPKEE